VLVVVGVGCSFSAWYLARLASNPHTVWNHKNQRMPWVTESQAHNQHLSLFTNVPKELLVDNTNNPNDLRGKI